MLLKMNMFKKAFVLSVFLSCFLHPSCQSDEVCLSLRQGPDQQAQVGPQGRPGRVGPEGPRGEKGSSGPPGHPGQCACDPSEVEQLQEQIRVINGTTGRFSQLLNHPRIRLQICSAGFRDGRIEDEDITASSAWGEGYRARYARLDNPLDAQGSWLPYRTRHRPGEWIQVDLKSPTQVAGVVTQGRAWHDQWITTFKISYGNSPGQLQFIRNANETDKIFQGSQDRHTHVFNTFPQPITARYFRLVVESFHNYISLRMELLYC